MLEQTKSELKSLDFNFRSHEPYKEYQAYYKGNGKYDVYSEKKLMALSLDEKLLTAIVNWYDERKNRIPDQDGGL